MITRPIFDATFNDAGEPTAARELVGPIADVDLRCFGVAEAPAYEAILYACDIEGEA